MTIVERDHVNFITKFFASKPTPPSPVVQEGMKVAEGIMGTFHYHLAEHAESRMSLCGVSVMPTNIPLAAWGTRTHLNERWCSYCESLKNPE